jgi:hypothetical protein
VLVFGIIILTIGWIATLCTFYFDSFKITYADSYDFLDIFLLSVTRVFGAVASGLILFKTRKINLSLLIFYFISVISCILIVTLPEEATINKISSFGVNFAMCGSLSLIYFTNVFLFPPIYRGTAFGITNFFARIFTAIAPFVNSLALPIPFYIFGAMLVIAILVTPFIQQHKDADDIYEEEEHAKLDYVD